jgi:two-component system, NarL family, response regulator DegU
MPLRIAICCCNDIYGVGIKYIVEGNGLDLDDTIVCSKTEEIIDAKPDLLIADFSALSKISVDTLVIHKVEILILWSHCLPKLEDKRLYSLISKGIVGILSPKINPAGLSKAIKKAVAGELWFDRKKLKDVVSNMNNVESEIQNPLTKKEMEVVKLICKGYRNKEIMLKLCIREQSVRKHLNRIFKKVGVNDRLQLALHAVKHWPDCQL